MAKVIKFHPQTKIKVNKIKAKRSKAQDRNLHGQLSLFGHAISEKADLMEEELYFAKALELDEAGDQGAAAYYLKAIEKGECVADAWCNLGLIYFQQQQHVQAVECFANCISHQPKHPEGHYNLANLYAEMGNMHLARIHYLFCVEFDTEMIQAYYNLALVMINEKRYHDALKYLNIYSEKQDNQADPVLAELKETLIALVS